jgi:ubiquinone/menaquinone biosynthesis C-methylase UbiE
MQPDMSLLCCPRCLQGLQAQHDTLQDSLQCAACGQLFPVLDDIPHLLLDDSPVTHLSHDDYDEHHDITDNMHQTVQRMWETVFQENHLPLSRVLELGCGTGQLTSALAALPDVQQLHSTDISPTFLHMTRQLIGASSKTTFYACDANHLAFADNRFDLVVGNSVLHHFLDYPAVLKRCHALLKPGGAAVFFEPVLQGKIMVAFLASLMLRIARKTGYGALTPEDEKKIETLVRHITKSKEFNQQPDKLAGMEDKYVFDLHELKATGMDAGFRDVIHRNNPAQDGHFRFNLHQHLSMAGITDDKIAAYRFLLNAAHELLIEMTPRDLFTPMGFFVFRK